MSSLISILMSIPSSSIVKKCAFVELPALDKPFSKTMESPALMVITMDSSLFVLIRERAS